MSVLVDAFHRDEYRLDGAAGTEFSQPGKNCDDRIAVNRCLQEDEMRPQKFIGCKLSLNYLHARFSARRSRARMVAAIFS
jgi:hypothetical protein